MECVGEYSRLCVGGRQEKLEEHERVVEEVAVTQCSSDGEHERLQLGRVVLQDAERVDDLQRVGVAPDMHQTDGVGNGHGGGQRSGTHHRDLVYHADGFRELRHVHVQLTLRRQRIQQHCQRGLALFCTATIPTSIPSITTSGGLGTQLLCASHSQHTPTEPCQPGGVALFHELQ